MSKLCEHGYTDTDDELIARIVASIAGTRYLSKGPRGEVAELVRRYREAWYRGYSAGQDEAWYRKCGLRESTGR